MLPVTEILAIHRSRVSGLRVSVNPLQGDPDSVYPRRRRFNGFTSEEGAPFYIPETMVGEASLCRNYEDFVRLRCRHDFEFWCATCCTIKHKLEPRLVPFVLNAPQRRVLSLLERERLAGHPLRMIMLKARQWGGSTLIQAYMAWIQCCLMTNWHSVICSHVKDASANIRGMYTRLLDHYPRHLWEAEESPRLRPFEGSSNIREIAGRGCRLTVASSENQDSVRGSDYAMAHLSETAFWRSSPMGSPEDVIRSVCGSIPSVPLSLVVMESTANGVGNYFHSEWLRSKKKESDKVAVFVPWYEIEIYSTPVADNRLETFAASLTDYEKWLFTDCGCNLHQINWYRRKRREFPSHVKMMAEFPSTDEEAFAATSSAVFSREGVEALRADCTDPVMGEMRAAGDGFMADERGRLALWQQPQAGGEYVVSVDVGGRTDRADFSVVCVVRHDLPRPEVVAQWRGHIDHDLLASTAATIARWYGEALLVVESNSLENGQSLYLLDRLADSYPNIYRRRTFDSVSNRETTRVGFHTNRHTKQLLISHLVALVREHGYVERDNQACDELATYEERPDGSYAAKPGCHDDILMARAMALYCRPAFTLSVTPPDWAGFF